MSGTYFITSYVTNNQGKLYRFRTFRTYEINKVFSHAFYLAYYGYINCICEGYNICMYPEKVIGQRYDLTFEQIASMYDIINCIKNKEYSKKMNSKKRKWLKIF